MFFHSRIFTTPGVVHNGHGSLVGISFGEAATRGKPSVSLSAKLRSLPFCRAQEHIKTTQKTRAGKKKEQHVFMAAILDSSNYIDEPFTPKNINPVSNSIDFRPATPFALRPTKRATIRTNDNIQIKLNFTCRKLKTIRNTQHTSTNKA